MSACDELPTPCLLVDRARFNSNVARMRDRLDPHGCAFRLHVKTTKSVEATQAVFAAAAPRRIMVSTLAEARHFHTNGFRDITYGVGIAPQKLNEVADLVAAGADLKVVVDNRVAARAVSRCGRERGVTLKAFIEIDTDNHRAGVLPDSPELLEVGRALAAGEGGGALAGVLTHAGESYNCTSVEAIRRMAEQERAGVVAAANALRRAGIECPEVSLGSTPTAFFATRLDGVTEVRAGVYVFQDLVMAGLGVCDTRDVALSVLATVIGHQVSRNLVICDAGWMALSRDRGTARQTVDQGFGIVLDEEGEPLDDLLVTSTNQEHGVITSRSGSPVNFGSLPVGARLRILPNHACATAAQHTGYHVIENRQVVAYWRRIQGW